MASGWPFKSFLMLSSMRCEMSSSRERSALASLASRASALRLADETLNGEVTSEIVENESEFWALVEVVATEEVSLPVFGRSFLSLISRGRLKK